MNQQELYRVISSVDLSNFLVNDIANSETDGKLLRKTRNTYMDLKAHYMFLATTPGKISLAKADINNINNLKKASK